MFWSKILNGFSTCFGLRGFVLGGQGLGRQDLGPLNSNPKTRNIKKSPFNFLDKNIYKIPLLFQGGGGLVWEGRGGWLIAGGALSREGTQHEFNGTYSTISTYNDFIQIAQKLNQKQLLNFNTPTGLKGASRIHSRLIHAYIIFVILSKYKSTTKYLHTFDESENREFCRNYCSSFTM